MKITNLMKDAVVAISQDKEPLTGIETMMKCVQAGLLDYADREYSLTVKGSKVASERKKQLELQKAKRGRSARARRDVMKSLGLQRTRSGAYEGIEDNSSRLRTAIGALRDVVTLG